MHRPSAVIVVALPIEDLLIAVYRTADLEGVNHALHARLRMKDLRLASMCLGLEIKRDGPNKLLCENTVHTLTARCGVSRKAA